MVPPPSSDEVSHDNDVQKDRDHTQKDRGRGCAQRRGHGEALSDARERKVNYAERHVDSCLRSRVRSGPHWGKDEDAFAPDSSLGQNIRITPFLNPIYSRLDADVDAKDSTGIGRPLATCTRSRIPHGTPHAFTTAGKERGPSRVSRISPTPILALIRHGGVDHVTLTVAEQLRRHCECDVDGIWWRAPICDAIYRRRCCRRRVSRNEAPSTLPSHRRRRDAKIEHVGGRCGGGPVRVARTAVLHHCDRGRLLCPGSEAFGEGPLCASCCGFTAVPACRCSHFDRRF